MFSVNNPMFKTVSVERAIIERKFKKYNSFPIFFFYLVSVLHKASNCAGFKHKKTIEAKSFENLKLFKNYTFTYK